MSLHTRRFRAALLAGGAIGSFTLCARAYSQEAPAAPPPPSNTISEIVVTAQKRSENIQNVPIAIQALSPTEIRSLGVRSSADLGQFISNVDITSPAGEGNEAIVTIRGIGLNDYDSNNAGPNGVYVDETYISAPASQTFQTFDLDRIEVLKGPQGTLYGRNTSGGALNFITAKPSDTVKGDLLASYGSFNTLNVEAALGGPIAASLDGRVAVVTNQSDGYFHDLASGKRENGSNNFAGRAELQWKPTSALTVLFNLHGGRVDQRPTEYRHIGTLDSATGLQCGNADILAGRCVDAFGTGTPRGFYSGSVDRTAHLRTNDWGGYGRADYDLGAVKLTSLTSFNHNDRFHPEDTDATALRLLEIDFGAVSNTVTQEFRASHTGGRLNWVAGVYYLHEVLKQDQPLSLFADADLVFGAPGAGDGFAARLYDRSRQQTAAYAAFGQADYRITDRLKLTLGGRYSYEHKSFDYQGSLQTQQGGLDSYGPILDLGLYRAKLTDDSFNYRAALDYTIRPGLLAYVSIATGFKSGGFNGSFLSTDPAEIARQLVPVRPEHVRTYETGFKGIFLDRRLLFDVAAFYNEYTDEQVFTPVNSPVPTNPPLNVLDNAPKAHTQGFDIQVIAKPVTGLTLSENLGLLEAKLDQYTVSLAPGAPDYSGNRLPLAPRVSSSTVADYRFQAGSGTADLQLSAAYKSRQFFDTTNDPLVAQKGYWIVNGRLAYTLADQRTELAVYAHNLLDRKYISGASNLSNTFGILEYVVGRPREVGVELNFKF